MKINLDAFCCGKCIYYNGDMNDKKAFCDKRESCVSADFYCYRYQEDEGRMIFDVPTRNIKEQKE